MTGSGDQGVAETAVGADVAMIAGVFQLAAQIGHMQPQQVQIRDVGVAPDPAEEILVTHHAPRIGNQHGQQPVLSGCEKQGPAPQT